MAKKPDDEPVKLVVEPVVEVVKPVAEVAKPETKDANTVLVQAVRSFAGEEGDKGPTSPPFEVSRQRYADLKANNLVELVK